VRIPTLLAPPEPVRSKEDPSGPVSSALTPAPAGIETILAETGVGSDTRVLVVEDHAEMRQLICEELGGEYHVLEAEDGQQGIELAFAEMPDLVVSDVMMPGIDGFELCRTLKSDQRTSHVPVILLTALSETESRHQGLHDGADAYLAKPFDGQELRLRVRNLIEQRRRLAQRYQNMFPGALPDSMKVQPQSDRFVQHVQRIIDEHLEDPEFRINELCREVGLSRSQLHRKLKAVTGRTTSDFVRTHRLHRAAQLLESGYGNVTEVAYAVGFHSLSYFSRSFRDLFGVQPSDCLRRDPGT
jgi:DNA-binding response OmpR family regulator